MTRVIPLAEVKKHNNSKSTWMVIHNNVYDVTTFLDGHPGGADTLLEYAGIDGTQAFEEVGHSDDARDLMKQYKIGTLSPDEQTKQADTCCSRIPETESAEKTWRTYDGSPSSRYTIQAKSEHKTPSPPRVERRVQAIVVPRERRPPPCEPPCGYGSSRLKWALLALAGAIVIGVVMKKYMS